MLMGNPPLPTTCAGVRPLPSHYRMTSGVRSCWYWRRWLSTRRRRFVLEHGNQPEGDRQSPQTQRLFECPSIHAAPGHRAYREGMGAVAAALGISPPPSAGHIGNIAANLGIRLPGGSVRPSTRFRTLMLIEFCRFASIDTQRSTRPPSEAARVIAVPRARSVACSYPSGTPRRVGRLQ